MPKSDEPRAVAHSEGAWSAAAAERLALRACNAAHIAPTHFELLRFGTNAVYRLVGTPWVLRLGRPGTEPESVERQLPLAQWLAERGYPANRPAADLDVVHVGLDGAIASFWEWVAEEPDTRVQPRALGGLIRDFHNLTNSYPAVKSFPRWAPLDDVEDRLKQARQEATFLAGEIDLMESWSAHLSSAISDIDWALPPGLVHGDAHTGNVLSTSEGPVMIDLDLLSVGPREWDLAPTVVSNLRFAGNQLAAKEFAGGYGFNVTAWSGWPTIKLLRELYMTSWLISVATTPERQAEVRHRLQYWREPDEGAVWHAV